MANKINKIRREYYEPVCQQYVLRTKKEYWYPCFGCPDSTFIFLKKGEVWRYGVTGEAGENVRYPNGVYYQEGEIRLDRNDLLYETEYWGTRPDCEIKEQEKIYGYPQLPEAKGRNLTKPPGNKRYY